MAIGSFSTLSHTPPKFDRVIKLAERNQNLGPFSIFVDSIDSTTRSASVRVSKFSSIFSDYSLDSNVFIVGLDYSFSFSLGDKIWLEVLYDRLGNPICPKIKSGTQWTRQTVNPASTTESIDVYPSQIELITRYDLSNKTAELNAEYSDNNLIKTAITEQIAERLAAGLITTEESVTLLAELNTNYAAAQEDLLDLINNLGDFFQGSSTLRKKQLRSFTLIGSATDTFDSTLTGETISPVPTVDPESTPTVVLPGRENNFKIVQHCNTDLILNDLFYLDSFLCKIPVLWTKGLY